ncbi:MAG: pyruvate kinase [Candidatus Zixiibacteriota bacterium]|nr:MAG: pyruvate kinase [candidate division Zixibacteria bacterium]
MRKTKIIATYGPAVASPSRLSQLAAAGVNVFRVNCAYGAASDFVKAADMIRRSVARARFPVGLLFDIAGPKLRLERFDGKISLKAGQTLKLTAGRADPKARSVTVNQPAIISSLKKGERVYIDDGSLAFDVTSAGRKWATLKALDGGTLLPGKGINLPQSKINIPTLSEKDKEDIKTAIRVKADYIALSFVRSPDDVVQARHIVESFGGDQRLIAKLEKRQAVEKLDEIVQAADGVMVARGDLGVETPFALLPRLQKRIIALANAQHKPAIVATQMLESMRFSARATRAEINDVASAVFDGADAVMLSAETATGKYPLETVKTMDQVITASEEDLRPPGSSAPPGPSTDITGTIAEAVSRHDERAVKLILAFTTSGRTAAAISCLFPMQPIVALTPGARVLTRLSLLRSVYPVRIEQPRSFEDMLATVQDVVSTYRLAGPRDKVIIAGGAPFGSTAPTNFMMLYEIGKRRKNARRQK